MNAILALGTKVLGGLGTAEQLLANLPAILAFFLNFSAFLHAAVVAAEQTGKSGTDKMTDVISAAEVFFQQEFPQFAKPFGEIAQDVEAIVNGIVATYNAGIWKKL